MKCPKCGARQPRDGRVCGQCGAELGSAAAARLIITRTPAEISEVSVFGPTMLALGQNKSALMATFSLDRPVVVIGRDDDCDIVLQHFTVSRIHVKVTREEGEFRIEDLGSTNGTEVNTTHVDETALANGDVLGVGEFSLTFFRS